MNLIGALPVLLTVLAGGLPRQTVHAQEAAAAGIVRRVAATATLAAQEYRIGVKDGRVVAEAEVEEARLFLEEARRSAASLPAGSGPGAVATLDSLLALVRALGSPDSLDAGARAIATALAT